MSYTSPTLSLIVQAVKKATTYLDRDFNEIEKLQSSVRNYQTFVRKSYEKVEEVLRLELQRIRPSAPIVDQGQPTSEGSCFLINPIDGFANFVRGVPLFATTVAYSENGEIKAAVVYNRASDELYFAEKGNGAYKEGFRNHERLRVSPTKDHNQALISAQIGYGFDTPDYTKAISKVFENPRNIRMLGAVSLDMASVAAGKFDMCLSLGNEVASVAAGLLLIKEAGGYVYGLDKSKVDSAKLEQILVHTDIAGANNSLESLAAHFVNK